MPDLLELLKHDPVVCAEGYLFECERRGYLQAGAFVPEVVLEHPEVVEGCTVSSCTPGSDVVEAFTYYGHREKLRVIGKEDILEPLNRQALAIAAQVARERARYWPGTCATPTSTSPGPSAERAVRSAFEEQVRLGGRGRGGLRHRRDVQLGAARRCSLWRPSARQASRRW